jgi:hypothetical protein
LRHARPAAEIAKLDKRYRLPQCEEEWTRTAASKVWLEVDHGRR